MAVVDFGGVTKGICLAFTPEAGTGEYVLIHAGFAIAVLDERAAQALLDLFEEIGILDPDSDRTSPWKYPSECSDKDLHDRRIADIADTVTRPCAIMEMSVAANPNRSSATASTSCCPAMSS